ncbi:MAG: hypothetical protein J6X25_00600 [Bacteroidales bacterium]|jgi:uncharacterized protein (DUF1778 family)|nr:hypothetical protein [Bacteroidales bacterium]
MITMSTSSQPSRIQTAFRLEIKLISKLKEAARQAHISLNDYVSSALKEATKDVVTEEEKEEERRKTAEFLDSCAGSWKGPESTQEIKDIIKEGRSIRGPISL